MVTRNVSDQSSTSNQQGHETIKLRVLGCSGGQIPGHNLSSYLLNDSLLIDAGSTTSALNIDEQEKIENILVTHAHLDHVMNLATLSDNLFDRHSGVINVWGIADTISALSTSFFNEVIWPDFTKITSDDRPAPVIALRELPEDEPVSIAGMSVTAISVSHSVPGSGFLIEKDGRIILHIGDTGPTEKIWQAARSREELSAVFVEASFPNRLKVLASDSGHLTPETLADELAKLARPSVPVYVTHLKPLYRDEIIAELNEVKDYRLILLNDGDVIEI